MKYSDLKRSLANNVRPIYLVCGADDYLRNYAIKLICDKCLQMPDLNFLSFDATNCQADYLDLTLNSLRSYPFLSDYRVVVLKEFYPTADVIKNSGLKEYCNAPEQTSILIISNQKESKNLDKLEMDRVDCTADLSLCVGWISMKAKEANIQISPQAASKIAEFCMLDFTKINSEMSKLLDYSASSGVIDLTAVTNIVHRDCDYQIYEMIDRIITKRPTEAYAILTDLLNKNESEQKLFISIYSQFRRMLHIALSSESDAALAEYLGVKEYAIKVTRRQTKKLSAKTIKEICEKLSYYDERLKAGDFALNNVLWNTMFSVITNI